MVIVDSGAQVYEKSRPAMRTTRKNRRLVLAAGAMTAAAALVLSGCSSSGGSGGGGGGSTSGDFVIGFTSQFTGVQANLGSAFSVGLKAAVADFNNSGGVGGRKISLKTLDDAGDPGKARANTLSFIQSNNALAVIGFTASATTVAGLPLAAQYKVPFLVQTFNTPEADPNNGYKWVFTTSDNPNSGEQKAEVDFAATLIKKDKPRVAISSINTTSGKLGSDALAAAIKAKGWDLVANKPVELTGTNTAPAIAAIAASKPDIVLVSLASHPEVAMLQGMRSAGITVPIVNYAAGSTLDVLTQLKDPNLYGETGFNYPTQTDKPGIVKYNTLVKAQGGDPNAFYVPNGYSQGLLLTEALKSCGKSCTRDGLRDALDKISNFDGDGFYTGPVGYTSSSHIAIHNYAIVHLVDGKVELVANVQG